MRKAGLIALGAVAILVAVGFGISLLDGESSRDSSAGSVGQFGYAPSGEQPGADQQAPGAVPPPAALAEIPGSGLREGSESEAAGAGAGGPGPALPQVVDRKIIRTATLDLTVEDVGAAVREVETAALSVGGFVSGSSLSIENPPQADRGEDVEPPQPRQRATITIRVPADAYAGVMSRLRGIAQELRSETSEASEVTEEYTDLRARLRNLEATEQRYLELLARAETIPDILTVQDRLNQVRLEIEQVQGRLNLLDNLTEMATITVQLALPAPPVEDSAAQKPAANWAEKAWENAWEASEDVLQVAGTAAITGVVILVWLLLPAAALLVGWRFWPRGERKGTVWLDKAPDASIR